MEARRPISNLRTAGLFMVAAAWTLFLVLAGSPEAILFTVPVFLLAAPLALGRYVGEETLAALRVRSRRRTGAAPVFTLPSAMRLLAGRVGLTLTPVRGPPAASC
ncbi:MAG: hypothetical protein KDB52_04880 [Solirubrobacterales bacterium]|nr:hypothetical protein [Solirubrobacterales bacterium]